MTPLASRTVDRPTTDCAAYAASVCTGRARRYVVAFADGQERAVWACEACRAYLADGLGLRVHDAASPRPAESLRVSAQPARETPASPLPPRPVPHAGRGIFRRRVAA